LSQEKLSTPAGDQLSPVKKADNWHVDDAKEYHGDSQWEKTDLSSDGGRRRHA
jgi:hypothetical protein